MLVIEGAPTFLILPWASSSWSIFYPTPCRRFRRTRLPRCKESPRERIGSRHLPGELQPVAAMRPATFDSVRTNVFGSPEYALVISDALEFPFIV